MSGHSLSQGAWLSHPSASLHSTLLTLSHGPSTGPCPLTMLHLWKIQLKPSTLSSSIQLSCHNFFSTPTNMSFPTFSPQPPLSSLPSTVHLSLKTITSTIYLYSSPSISPALLPLSRSLPGIPNLDPRTCSHFLNLCPG